MVLRKTFNVELYKLTVNIYYPFFKIFVVIETILPNKFLSIHLCLPSLLSTEPLVWCFLRPLSRSLPNVYVAFPAVSSRSTRREPLFNCCNLTIDPTLRNACLAHVNLLFWFHLRCSAFGTVLLVLYYDVYATLLFECRRMVHRFFIRFSFKYIIHETYNRCMHMMNIILLQSFFFFDKKKSLRCHIKLNDTTPVICK